MGKNKKKSGSSRKSCIFMDYRNGSYEDQNVVIYGHNMADRTMFGALKDVFRDDEEYTEFLREIKKRGFRNLNVDVTADDHILTLSTCAGLSGTGRRRVIHAKSI